MKKEAIKNLNIEDFKPSSQWMDYVDNDFIVASCMENLPYGNSMIRMNFFLLVICAEGEIELHVNGKPYVLQANDAIIILPTMIISRTMFSPRHKVRMIGISTRFLQQYIKKEKDTDNILSYLYNNPIIHDEQKENRIAQYYSHYAELILSHIHGPSQRFHKEILQSLFSAIFYEMLSDLYQYTDKEKEYKLEMNQGSILCKRFLMEVSKDEGMHRSVSYYADRLCYSSKYVSSVVKEVTGRTALEWINEYVVEQIKYRLKHSDQSIKEIAEYFNFPTQSFFGKYVKAHLGMSPARYRSEGE